MLQFREHVGIAEMNEVVVLMSYMVRYERVFLHVYPYAMDARLLVSIDNLFPMEMSGHGWGWLIVDWGYLCVHEFSQV